MRPHPTLPLKRKPAGGFTLVELSIVLVIIGLLVGGILAGQSLIRSAELKTILTDFSKYRTALTQFKNQYNGLPGDLLDATDYWGAADGSTGKTAGCATTTGTGTSTCNGDGDGLVLANNGYSYENYRIWQHLANAGLIQGNYTGAASSTNISTTLNSPVGKQPFSMWFVYNWGVYSGVSGIFNNDYTNSVELGKVAAGSWPYNALFKPEEQAYLDSKIDDGKPATGQIVTFYINAGTCTPAGTDNTTVSPEYNVSYGSAACFIVFPRMIF